MQAASSLRDPAQGRKPGAHPGGDGGGRPRRRSNGVSPGIPRFGRRRLRHRSEREGSDERERASAIARGATQEESRRENILAVRKQMKRGGKFGNFNRKFDVLFSLSRPLPQKPIEERTAASTGLSAVPPPPYRPPEPPPPQPQNPRRPLIDKAKRRTRNADGIYQERNFMLCSRTSLLPLLFLLSATLQN